MEDSIAAQVAAILAMMRDIVPIILYQKNYNDDEYKLRKNRGQLDQYYLPDHHVSIVAHDAFDNVEALIAQRRKECKTEERAAAGVYPFRSRLFCAECGMPLNRVKGETGITYACGGFIRKAGCTKGTRVFEETVKNAFLTVLNKLSFSQKLVPYNRILDVYINSIREREREKNKKRLDEIDHELKMHSRDWLFHSQNRTHYEALIPINSNFRGAFQVKMITPGKTREKLLME